MVTWSPTAIHRKDIYKQYIGVDACMANLMRPGMYGAYHHISVVGKEDQPRDCTYDVVGSLCENNDKFAIDRPLPRIEMGDLLVIHDAGAHGHSMGFQYNGKLRSAGTAPLRRWNRSGNSSSRNGKRLLCHTRLPGVTLEGAMGQR